jgi:hypothetical protein
MKHALISVTVLLASLAAAQDRRTIVDMLNLTPSQIVRLEELYDYVHGVRYEQERRKAVDAEKHVRRAFGAAQTEAKRLLSPGQTYLLEQRAEELRVAHEAKHRLLILATFEEFMAMPVDVVAATRWLQARDAYRRDRRYRHYGFGFCGHWHWCDPTRPRCGGAFPTPGTGTRGGVGPGSTGSRGGSPAKGFGKR